MSSFVSAVVFALGVLTPQTAVSEPDPAVFERAYALAYNLDHNEAMELLKATAEAHPDSADAHRHVAIVMWLNILFQRGSVTVDSYMGSVTRSNLELPDPPADLAGGFHAYLNRSLALAEARVKANRRDVDALYDLGAAEGLRASYIATIEGKVRSSFGPARRAFNLHEDVLARDPARAAAGLIVGTYRYVISALSLPMRWAAYIAGFGGGKDEGIRLIEAASRDGETAVDASFALVLVYNREQRYDEALAVLDRLRQRFPKNRLLWLEHGSTSIRAGRGADAEAVLTEGLRKLDTDYRAKIPGERALWLYKRGMSRVLQQKTALARQDLTAALEQKPQGWVRGRATLELGNVAHLEGDRARAAALYREAAAICRTARDTLCEEEASRRLRQIGSR